MFRQAKVRLDKSPALPTPEQTWGAAMRMVDCAVERRHMPPDVRAAAGGSHPEFCRALLLKQASMHSGHPAKGLGRALEQQP